MPAPVSLVTVHHEGGGAPSDNVGRFAHGGYTYGVGVSSWARFRSVWDSWGTLNYNGESVDVCLSGLRCTPDEGYGDGFPITDNDLDLIGACLRDARSLGYVVDEPVVRAHKNSPGSGTVCPGGYTMARWPEVVAACHGTTSGDGNAPPNDDREDDDMPASKDFVAAFASSAGAWRLQYDGGVETMRGKFYGSYFTLPANVRNDPGRRFLAICAPVDGSPNGYTIVSTRGEAYTFTKPQ